MHVHTVLVKLHDPSTATDCRDLMESMAGRIEDMVSLRVDLNNLAGSYSCDLSLTTTWPDLDAYRRYTVDPVHLEVRAQVLELTAEAMTIDYTIDPDAASSSGVAAAEGRS